MKSFINFYISTDKFNNFNNYLDERLKKILVLGILLFQFISAQNIDNIKNAYNNYIKTGNKNFIRFQLIDQLIDDVNKPDFIAGAIFLRDQNHLQTENILIEVLQTYNRYDLIEEIFFSDSNDKSSVYQLRYKDLYYLSLLNNLKLEELLQKILSKIEEFNFQQTENFKKTQNFDSSQVYEMIRIELNFFQEVARKGERQISQWEEAIREYPFSGNKKKKREILFSYFYSGLNKKEFLKKVYTYLTAEDPSPETPKTSKPELSRTSEIAVKEGESTNDSFFNSADNFFNLETTQSEKTPPSSLSVMTADRSDIVYTVIKQRVHDHLLNLLYQKGFYRSYIHLFKKQKKRLTPNSPQYAQFLNQHRERLSRALLYTQKNLSIVDDKDSLSEKLQLKRLFFKNEYDTIIRDYKSWQQDDFYLLSLAAQGSWDILFLIAQSYPDLLEKYLMISLLDQNPTELLIKLQSLPANKLKAWQLDFLNLVEEGLEPQNIAPLFKDFLFKKRDILSGLISTPPILYEYGIVFQAQILRESGESQKVNEIFRNYYNRIKNPTLKERLMFLHGMAYLSEDPSEGEKILFQLLTLNPQSSYRFDIEEALNSLF